MVSLAMGERTCTIDPSHIDWAESARNVAIAFRQQLQGAARVRNLSAAVWLLSKFQSLHTVFDLQLTRWCTESIKLFQRAANGEAVDIDQAEAANWFDVLSFYF